MPAGEQIAQTAEGWLGTPFHWQGRVRAGCDCKGLLAGVAGECGRPEADSLQALAGDYGPRVDVQRLLTGLSCLFDRVAEIAPGDVLLLKVSGKPQHLAIAAPKDGKPSRAIQALHTGPCKVVASRVPRDMVHSIWRWRD
jgi:cell wall-associated NlpC family hydrolase